MRRVEGRALGWEPDPPDDRDYTWRETVAAAPAPLPRSYRVRTAGPVLNQGNQPRCVAFATASVKMIDEHRESKQWYAFDEAWLYGLCKEKDGIPDKPGTFLRIALGIVQKQGYLAHGTYLRAKKQPGPDRTFRLASYVRLRS